MTRITYLGDEIQHDNRDRKGRYAKKSRLLFLVLILGAVSFIAFNAHFNSWYDNEISYVAPVYAGITMEARLEMLKDGIIEELAECESNNAPQEEALVTYDNNSRETLTEKHVASLGVLQFKVATVQQFWKQLYGEEISNYEATILALDNERAKILAKEAIIGIKGAIWHWSCATKEMGIKIEIIRDLEK